MTTQDQPQRSGTTSDDAAPVPTPTPAQISRMLANPRRVRRA